MNDRVVSAQEALRRVGGAARSLLRGNTDPSQHEDFGEAFADAYRRASPYTMTSRERMYALWQATMYVSQAAIPGDIVECGVWRGGSSMLAALALLDAGDPRQLWMYDTYEGMTEPSEQDRRWDGESAAERLENQPRAEGKPNDWAFASLEDVKRQMSSVGYPADAMRFVKGPVEETIPRECPDTISLLRLDTDWYESTRHELQHLWPLLSPGGVLIIDDYGHWQGARQAVDEFLDDHGIALLLNRVDYTGRMAIKPVAADASPPR